MTTRPQIAFLVPCLNEATTIATVVGNCLAAIPEATVWVCDNGSDDDTAASARSAGARVLVEPRRGKGRAVRKLLAVDADILILVDGDDTHPLSDAGDLVRRLRSEGLDLVVGRRIHTDPDAYPPGRRLGNRIFGLIASTWLGRRIQDPLSGYRILTRRFARAFPARADEFEIEIEMTSFACSSSAAWVEVDTPYRPRPPGSNSKLRLLHDGLRITLQLIRAHGAHRGARLDPVGNPAPDSTAASVDGPVSER